MARRGIALIGSDQLNITVSDPEFSPLVASVLGNEITDTDGWDNDISVVASSFAPDSDLVDSLAQHIADADFVDGAADTSVLAPITDATAQFQSDGDALFSKMSDAIDDDPSKQPPSGGSGGGGGGGDGGGGGGGGGGGTPGGGGGGAQGGGGTKLTCEINSSGTYDCILEIVPGGGEHAPLQD